MALLAVPRGAKVDREIVHAVAACSRVLQDAGPEYELLDATCRGSQGRRFAVVVYRYWGMVFWLN